MNVKVQNKLTGDIYVISTDDFNPEIHNSVLCPCEEPITKVEEKTTDRFAELKARGYFKLSYEERREYQRLKPKQ